MQMPQPSFVDRDNVAKQLDSKTINGKTYRLVEWTNEARKNVWYSIRVTDGWNAPFSYCGRAWSTLADARAIFNTIN